MARAGTGSSPSIEALKQRMARDPLSRAFLQLAEEYRKAGRFEEAMRVCQEGLSRHPTYHTARISLGRTYLEAGDLERARRTLAEVVEMAPENHLAGKLLAEVQRRMGDLKGAAETYRSILRHYPADLEVEGLLKDLLDPGAPAPSAPEAPRARASGPAARPAADPSLDYRPEDLLPSQAVASAASPPQRAPERPAPAAGAADDALQTNTLAELYLRQGLVDKAVEVYHAMLRVDPGNLKARRRLDDLLKAAPGAVAPASAAPPLAPPSPLPGRPAPPQATVAGAPPDDRRRRAAARLEGWLRRIHSGSAGGGEAARR